MTINAQVWNCLVDCTCPLGARELIAEVRQALADNLVDADVCPSGAIEADLARPPATIEADLRKRYQLMGDAVSEMEWWAAFHPEDEARVPPEEAEDESASGESSLPHALPPPARAPTAYVAPTPHRAGPKIGRNDPCPCGSGRKYKKCCLAKTA